MQFPLVKEYTQEQILEKTKNSAQLSKNILQEISLILKPGITESQARDQALEIHKHFGVEKCWHNPYIRFGENTILTFKDKPEVDRTLREDDIAYVDIGPIINGVEGDVGQTFVFGEDKLFQSLKTQSEKLFLFGLEFWRKEKPTGIVLYEYIKDLSKKNGFIFNLNPAGHLIGSFPHKGWKEGLNTYPYYPEPGYWILEIQIRDNDLPYGAFFEDVLL